MTKTRLIAAAAAALLWQGAHAAQWECFAGAPLPAQAVRLTAPRGVAVARDDTVYFTDGAAVRVLRADGSLATLAGDVQQNGWRDGPGAAARFNAPSGLAVGADGTVFVADTGNHVLRAIAPSGAVSTLAGQPGTRAKLDGKGGAARFNQPMGVAIDAAGALLVADFGNQLLRRVTRDGAVRSLPHALPFQPQGVAADARGGLLVTDGGSALYIDRTGAQRAMDSWFDDARAAAKDDCWRGKCLRRYLAVSVPVASGGQLAPAVGLAADARGRLLAVSPASATLYRIESDGVLVPLAGQGDVTGAISGVAAGPQGQLTVLLEKSGYAARWDGSGRQQAFSVRFAASMNRDGPALRARFGDITQLAVGRDGSLYVLDGDQLRRIGKNGEVQTLREQGGFRKLDDAQAAQVDLHGSLVARPSTGVFVSADGALAGVSAEGDISFVSGPPGMQADATGLSAALRRIWAYASAQAEPFVLPGLGQNRIGAHASGQAYYCADGVLWRIRPRGAARKTVLQGEEGCGDVLVSPNDDVFLLHGHYVTRVGTDGHQMLAAGSRERKGRQDGAALHARFRRITAGAVDEEGKLYLVDDGAVRVLTPNAEVGSIALDGAATAGKLRAIAVGRKGVLYAASERTIYRLLAERRR